MFNSDYYKASTPKEHIEKVEAFCKLLESKGFVEDALINDYGRYSNFDFFVYAPISKKEIVPTRKIMKQINECIKELNMPVIVKLVEPPRKYYVIEYGERRCAGFDRKFWKFDLDFNSYNKESNTFLEAVEV